MAEQAQLRQDINELLSRINDNGMAMNARDGKEEMLATALVLPTISDRGFNDTVMMIAKAILDRRDVEGGWDDPWTTVFAMEGLVGLALRGIVINDLIETIHQGVKVLKGYPALSPPDHELRLARALALAGLALKDAKIINSGLIRARSAVDSGLDFNTSRDTALHGLLALIDLYTLTKDPSTKALYEERFESSDMIDPEKWAQEESVDVIARAGTVLEKAGYKDAAAKAYEYSRIVDAESLDTQSLKHRVELGARLFGEELKNDKSDSSPKDIQVSPEKIKSQPVLEDLKTEIPTADRLEAENTSYVEQSTREIQETVQPQIDQLPALQKSVNTEYSVSAIIIQHGETAGINETIKSVAEQHKKPGEVIVVLENEQHSSHDSIIPFNVRYISPSEYDTEGKRWSLGVNAAENDWIWIIPSGIKPQAGTLDRMITGVNSETDAVLLVEEESDKAKLFSELYGEPISHQYRVLLKKESLDKHGFSNRMQAEPLWLFVLKNQETLNWNEVVENNNASFEGLQENSLSFMDDQIFDAFEIKRELKLTDPRIKEKLHDFASKSRRLLHEKHRRVGIPLVSIVIPHFNLPEMLERCIDSIVTNTDEIPFEIIVVDNGSNNTTDELIKKLHKSGVYIIRNSTNEGFAKACNKGSKEAKGKYVLFLNNDTEVQKGWLSAMMRAMQEGEEVGIVGAKLLFPDGKIQHVGVVFDDDCIPSHLYQNGPSNLPQIQNRRYYQVVTAACTLIRKNLFRQLGGFDEGFRNSFEDVDFCLRARRMSVRALYEPEAVVIHHTEQTPGRKDHDSENINRYLERWGGKVQPDLKLYANIDGYDIVEKDGRKKLVPFNDGQSEKTVEKSSPPPDQTTDVKENINTAPTLSAQPVDVSVKNEDTLESLLAKADLMIKDGRFNNAEEELVNGSRRVNGNIRQRALYWTLLGDARFRLNRPDEAFTCYKKAVSDDPSAERAWIGIGTYHLINDELDTAEEIFGKILTLSPEYDRGFMGMGNVMLKRKEFDKALKNFQEASRLTPDHRPAIVGLVASAVQAGKMMEAQPGVERYLQIHPEDVEARFHLAAIFYGCSHIEKARIHAEHVLETHPNHRGAKELMNHIEES